MELVAIELGWTVRETPEVMREVMRETKARKWDRSGFSLKYASYVVRPMALCHNRFFRKTEWVGGHRSREDSVP